MKLVYGALKEADIHLSREEYAFNLRRMEQVLDEMCPEFLSEMRHDVEELVSGCAPYYWRYGKLDVLRAWREEWGCPESQQEPESREVEEYEEAERESPPPQPSISGSTTKGSMLAARAASGEAAPEEPDDAAEAESGSGEEAPGYRYSDAEQAAMIAEAMAEIEAIRQAAEEEQRAPPARPPLTDEERQLAWRTARLVAS